ncbi:hypothetical protein Ddye_018666 [Dipteronia dyeriana]|uniref:Leucine-rich repeat-containing N-terminal plant-type domain-containing protein n=1 Tax=Dipteronia dyeriana TaxID=168575 RepID=A0AAD9UBM4_9ROSI|nr:hypothetical protein Ddye_018666 [Dipteronia dyeriana]
MASTTCLHALLILTLHLCFLSNNQAVKHGHSSSTPRSGRHHHHSSSSTAFPNPKLHQAYIALQAWKKVIYSDPYNFTTNWVGPSVCNYKGIYCATPPYDHTIKVVADILATGFHS